ncbi:MAG: HAD-IIIA family hydrolase [Pseudomonadota bacterium]|nr:HAD-IIIA family hydrolase [Pseudomonadota bacterium]
MNRCVFLDRDGVIIRAFVREGTPFPPVSITEVEILPGVEKALYDLQSKGFLLVIVTNQPDVARGLVARSAVEKINSYIVNRLPIDHVYTCFHDTRDCCNCRKPSPGALISASKKHGIDLGRSYMVGDRWKDIEAGKAAGCKTIFLDYGYAEKQPDTQIYRVGSLKDAAEFIIGDE